MHPLIPERHPDFIAGPDGAIAPYTAPPPPERALTREEQIDAYRKGLRATADLLRELGFSSMYECEHSYTMAYRGIILDFRIQRPGQVAYITGRNVPGRTGTKGRHGGTIFKLSDEIKSEFALMIGISSRSSAPPVFVDLDVPDPAKTIVDSIVGLLKALERANDRLGTAVKGKELQGEVLELPEWL